MMDDSRLAAAAAATGIDVGGSAAASATMTTSSSSGRRRRRRHASVDASSSSASGVAAAANLLLEREAHEAEAETDHAAVLGRLSRHLARVSNKGDVRRVSLRSVHAVFCLSALCCGGSRPVGLSDLIRWSRAGAVSYFAALKNVPSVMQLRTAEDVCRFVPRTDPSPSAVKDSIFRLGLLLDLKIVDFNAHAELKKVGRR